MRPGTTIAIAVLLVATPRQRLQHVEEAMEAAGMSVVAVTSTALTVASCAQKLPQNAAVLLLNRSGGTSAGTVFLRSQSGADLALPILR